MKDLKEKLLAFSRKAIDSMKSDYEKGGFKKLIKNKYFIGVIICLFIILSSASQEDKKTKAPKTAAKNEKAASVEYSNLDFFTIRNNKKTMTDLQFKEFVKSIKGQNIKWNGYVEEIEEAFTGGYKILIDMDSPSEPLSVYDISFKIPKEQALSLKKDQLITFTGEINDVLSVMDSVNVDLEDPKIIY